jgi:ABC-type nitrate/sulfonate/bicarbonate transport system permease component
VTSTTTRRVPAAGRRGNLRLQAARVVFGLAVLFGWEALTRSGALTSSAFVPTSVVLESLQSVLTLTDLRSALAQTLTSWGIGLGLCVVIGVPVGAVLGSRSGVYSTVRVTLEFMRATPPVVLIPFVLLFFGPTQEMKIILITLGAIWPLLIQTMYGVHDIDPVVSETARLYRIRGRVLASKVVLPSVTPYVMTGLRVSGVLALLLAIGSEMITSAAGLGRQIVFAQTVGAMSTMYAYIIIVGVLGVAFSTLCNLADKRVLYWHPSMRSDQR